MQLREQCSGQEEEEGNDVYSMTNGHLLSLEWQFVGDIGDRIQRIAIYDDERRYLMRRIMKIYLIERRSRMMRMVVHHHDEKLKNEECWHLHHWSDDENETRRHQGYDGDDEIVGQRFGHGRVPFSLL